MIIITRINITINIITIVMIIIVTVYHYHTTIVQSENTLPVPNWKPMSGNIPSAVRNPT